MRGFYLEVGSNHEGWVVDSFDYPFLLMPHSSMNLSFEVTISLLAQNVVD